MDNIFSMPLRDILKKAASSEPTPGGGSISAICAALSVSMAAMVASLTIGKKKYKNVEEQINAILERAMAILENTENLVQKDISAFGQFMDAYKMPSGTPEEKEIKEKTIQEALKIATDAPLEIARTCLKILELTHEIAPIGNKMAVSDAGVAAYLGEAALGAALLNVDINLPLVKDKDFADKAAQEKEALLKKAAELKADSLAIVHSRMG